MEYFEIKFGGIEMTVGGKVSEGSFETHEVRVAPDEDISFMLSEETMTALDEIIKNEKL